MRLAPFALAVALLACQRPQPSADYQEAESRFRSALARYPLDAWSRPEMDGVLGLLARVPEGSADREAADALRARILAERKAIEEEEARRARMAEAAVRSAAPLVYNWEAPRPEAVAAPAAPAVAIARGMALETFEKEHGKCFAPRTPVKIVRSDGSSIEGQAWALKEDEGCKAAHGAEVGKLVLFAGGALFEIRDASDAKEAPAQEQVFGVRRPDGTMAVVGADGKPRDLPAGARLEWKELPADAAGATAAGATTGAGAGGVAR